MEEDHNSGVVEARNSDLVGEVRNRIEEAVVRSLGLAEGSRVAGPGQGNMTLRSLSLTAH